MDNLPLLGNLLIAPTIQGWFPPCLKQEFQTGVKPKNIVNQLKKRVKQATKLQKSRPDAVGKCYEIMRQGVRMTLSIAVLGAFLHVSARCRKNSLSNNDFHIH